MSDSRRLVPGAPRLGFAGNRLQRDGESRTEGTLAAALAHPQARTYLLSTEGWLCRGEPNRPDPAFTVAEAIERNAADVVLLGTAADGSPRLAAHAADPSDAGVIAADLRSLGMSELLDPDTEGQLATGAHILNWHRANRFCGRCGGETAAEAAGFRRRCLACGELIFPRTDPVSIMLVHDGRGNCVLGRQPRFAPGMWSCLAGFIEAGETLEDAVRRETLEEAGLTVGAVRYHSSQPWPFPGSLMIGCVAFAETTAVAFDAHELEDCRWFSRDEVRRMLEGRHEAGLTAPLPFAIAHHLVRAFVDGDV